jgi:hypothetical protein
MDGSFVVFQIHSTPHPKGYFGTSLATTTRFASNANQRIIAAGLLMT